MRSFGERLRAAGGYGPGFDMVRLVLCYQVLVWHAWVINIGSARPGKASIAWLPFEVMVPMFFALSGFLVAASAQRLPTGTFLANRAWRILPALVAVVLLAALVIGPLVTSLPLAAYVRDPAFARYFLNMAGIVRYTLPGVFEAAPVGDAVNGSLWTVPWEIACYLLLATLISAGLMRRAALLLGIALGWLLLSNFAWMVMPGGNLPDLAGRAVRFGLLSQGAMLVPYFLSGAALYLARERVPWDGRIAAAFVLMLILVSMFGDGLAWSRTPPLALALLAPCVYLVAWAGLVPMTPPPGFRGGDYSYGVYLCHFPILQAMQVQFEFDHWGGLLAAAVVPVTMTAMLSWHVIESPALKARRRYSLVGRRLVQDQGRGLHARR